VAQSVRASENALYGQHGIAAKELHGMGQMSSVVSIPGFADPFSSLSHLLGAALFAVFSVLLLRRGRGDTLRMASLAIFSFGTVFLLSSSGIMHLLGRDGTAHSVMRRIDHAAIFALIACSFTPIHVILFRGRQRWIVLTVVWIIAITGIWFKTMYFELIPPTVGTAIYIGMGWIGLVSWLAVVKRYGFQFASPIMWGGFAYTIGGVLDSLHWPVLVSGIIQWHEVFHMAVLIGLGCHWAFIFSVADRPLPPLGRLDEGTLHQCARTATGLRIPG
jgi:hemolysin III